MHIWSTGAVTTILLALIALVSGSPTTYLQNVYKCADESTWISWEIRPKLRYSILKKPKKQFNIRITL